MKKGILLSVVGMLAVSGGSASALVTLPNTGTIGTGDEFILSSKGDHVWTVDANGSKAYDLETGARQSGIDQDMRDFAVSDDATRHVALTDEGFVVYDATLKTMASEPQTLMAGQERVADFSAVAFLPGSHTVVFLADQSGEGKLIGYDLDEQIVTFVRGTQQFGELLTSDRYIFVKADEAVYVYTHDGKFFREITPAGTSSLQDIDVTRDGVLVVAGDAQGVRVYDGKHGFKSAASGTFMTSPKAGIRSVAIDPSGTYVAALDEDERFRLFDRAGRRIYTSLDQRDDFVPGPIALTNQAKTIMLGVEGHTNLYAGRTVIERTASVTIPKAHASIREDKKQTLQLSVKRLDGKTVTVRKGISWTTTSKTIRIKGGILYGVKPGSYTIKATYEGRTATLKGKVGRAPLTSLTDVDWLERHWASVIMTGTLEGAYAFSTPYNRIKGTKATLSISVSDGGFEGPLINDLFYYSKANMQYPKSNRLGIVYMMPALSGRKIQRDEVFEAFGRGYTKPWSSGNTSVYSLERENKLLARYGITYKHAYLVGGRNITVHYDKEDIARIISVDCF